MALAWLLGDPEVATQGCSVPRSHAASATFQLHLSEGRN